MDILEKLKENIFNLFKLHELEKEKLLQLLAALYAKEYKIKNPDKNSVTIASYYIKDLETKVISEYPVFECIDSKDHKRINQLERRYRSRYRKLELKSYCLKNIKIDKNDKMVAMVQKEITESLNR